MKIECKNRVPGDYFVTIGAGHSDISVHAGSYHQAMNQGGIGSANILIYTSMIPGGCREIQRPGTITHGEVLETIMAVSHTTGERATAGISYGFLKNKITGEEIGGIVCEYNGSLPEEEAKQELEKMFQELYESSYAQKYEYHGRKTIVKSVLREKRYATALVALCFTSAVLEEKRSIDCDVPFLGYESSFEEANQVVIPVPFDGTSSWLSGTDFAPRAVLHASMALEEYHLETEQDLTKSGFHTMPAIIKEQPDKMIESVQRSVSRCIKQQKLWGVLGGNHTVTQGALEAVVKHYPDVSVLCFDAHTDYRDEYQGSVFSHACAMKRASEICDNIVHVGIRSTSEDELKVLDPTKLFYSSDLMKNPLEWDEWIEEIMMQLDPDVYISFDLDAFDPSEVPAVSTPEPGGINWDFAARALKTISKHHNVVGFDVVELCPNRFNRASDFTAAKLFYSMFGYAAKYRKVA